MRIVQYVEMAANSLWAAAEIQRKNNASTRLSHIIGVQTTDLVCRSYRSATKKVSLNLNVFWHH